MRAPATAFGRIMRARGVDVGDAGPVDFIQWLETAPDDEISRIIELMRDFEQDARDTALAFTRGPEMRDLWRLRDQVAQTNDKALAGRSKGGRNRKQKRTEKDDALKAHVLSKAKGLRPKPRSRRQAALKIETALVGTDFERGYDCIYKILSTPESKKEISFGAG